MKQQKETIRKQDFKDIKHIVRGEIKVKGRWIKDNRNPIDILKSDTVVSR